MLTPKRSVPSAGGQPLRRLKFQTSAHMPGSFGWRVANFERRRQREERQCSCLVSKATDPVESVSDPSVAFELKTWNATLIVPHPFPDIDVGDTQFQKGFLMLTSESGFDLEITGPLGATLKPYRWQPDECTTDQWMVIEAFSKTALHRMLLRLCPLQHLKSAFWKNAIFLPCRIWDDRSEVAWDVMDALLNERTREGCRSFVRLLLQSWHRPKRPTKELMDTIKEITSQLPNDYPKIEKKSSWAAVRSFVEHCVLMAQWPVVKLQLDPNETRHRLKGCSIYVGFQTLEALSDRLNERTDTRLVEDMTLYPLPASWLISFLLLQLRLPDLVRWVDADRLRRVFKINHRLSIDSFVDDLQPMQNSNSQMTTLGNTLLRFMTVISRWQTSSNCTINNSKAASSASNFEIRNVVLGERLMKKTAIANILLDWCCLRDESGRVDVSPLDVDWSPILNDTNIDVDGVDHLEYLTPCESIGRNFKAFAARVYRELGLAALWDICKYIGLVRLKKGTLLEGYIRGWKSHDIGGIQDWENRFIKGRLSIRNDVFKAFSNRFGYKFREKHRFDWAMHHPSAQVSRSAHYGWMVVIGKAILDIFIQEDVTSRAPTMVQTRVNGVFNDSEKLDIFFDVAVDLGLHKISVQTKPDIAKIFSKSDKDREIMRTDASAWKYLAHMMLQLVATLALDTGLDLTKVMDIIQPHFNERIDRSIEIGDTGSFFAVESFVPTALEYRAAQQSSLKTRSYYRTDVRLCRASGAPCFAVTVLTKCRLKELSDFDIYQYREDGPIRVKIQSKDTIINIDHRKHKQLMQFQSDYFEPILEPAMEKIPLGERKKYYLVAPIAIDGSDIDWTLVQHVVSGTVPSEIDSLLRYLKETDKDDRSMAAKAVLDLDARFQLEEGPSPSKKRIQRSAARVLLFRDDLNHVSYLEEASGTSGVVLNDQCLLESFRDLPTDQKTTTIDFSTDRCLPYTKGYFACLSCLPFILERMENQLLAEDYRDIYGLPVSVTTDDIVMALTSNASAIVKGVGVLESIGDSLLRYLFAVASTIFHPTIDVGQQSTKRAEMLRTAAGSTEAMDTVMGHSLPLQFLPYKQGQSWHPPAVEPFTQKSIYDDQSPDDDDLPEKDSEPIEIRNEVSHRVRSGFAQNFSEGIPMKHFKVLAALCLLRDGPSAACDFWHRIGILELESYPSKPSPERKGGPKKYQKLEEVMGYTFRDQRLLARVFMHSTAFPKNGSNNESLEFLGDAAAELIIMLYIREKYPNIIPGEAAPLKMQWTKNDLFCWISASPPLELPSLLMHKLPKFDEVYQKFNGTSTNGFEDPTISKIASDLFEALLGAVLVDSGYSIDTVSRVMLKLMKEPLDDPARFKIEIPETVASL